MNETSGVQSRRHHILLLVLVGILALSTLGSAVFAFLWLKKTSAVANVATADAAAVTPIDLTSHYDKSTSWHRPGEWSDIPHGLHSFGGVPFEANGTIKLMGEGARKDRRSHPEKVEGIPVGKQFARLHLLHTSHYPAEDETPYAHVVLHYADGSSTVFQMAFGRHARDWWRSDAEAVSELSDTNSKVVWRGDDGGIKPGRTRRVFKTTFENPKPQVEVIALDLVSENATPNMTLFAISVGPANLPAPEDDVPSLPEPDGPYRGALKFTAVDSETGVPVPKVKVKISAEGRELVIVPEATTDVMGRCLVKYPGPDIYTLSLTVSGTGVTPTRIRWQPRRGDAIPAEYVFRVSRPLTVGGTVLDESNSPIANARIQFRDYAFADSPREPRERFQIHSASVRAGPDGTWEFKSLPPNFRDFSINVTHPEFVDAKFITRGTGRGFANMSMDSLTNQKAVIQMRRRAPFLDATGKPIIENILPNVSAGSDGIKNALPWWRELSSGRRDGIYDPSSRPGSYGIAWGVKGYDRTVVVFQTQQTLSFDDGGWYVQVSVPNNVKFSAEDLGKIQANWIEKTYPVSGTMKVRVLN